jgi:hypothetical protein
MNALIRGCDAVLGTNTRPFVAASSEVVYELFAGERRGVVT